MVHYHYIGHLDPADPLDLAQRPSPPKWTRPLSVDLVSRWAERLGVVLGREVEVFDDHLVSHLGYHGVLHPFEAALVAEGYVVLTEMYAVVQPRAARDKWQRWLRTLDASGRPTASA